MRLEAKRLTCDGFAAAPGVEVPIHLSNAENTPPPKTLSISFFLVFFLGRNSSWQYQG
jgi:hypothetical protein